MALGWASADLLTRFNDRAARPSSDVITDATKYSYLAEGQREVYNDIALRCPEALLGSPAAMTADSDRKIFTFSGSAIPVYAELYPSLEAIPDSPLVEGVDFLMEHNQVRTLNNRSHAGTIYARIVTTPGDIDASTEPSLEPNQARELIVAKALEIWGERGGLRTDVADRMAVRYERLLVKWLLYYHNQYDGAGRGAQSLANVAVGDWWIGNPDLGT